MVGEEPPASDEPAREPGRRWQDRDTEPIPRARPVDPSSRQFESASADPYATDAYPEADYDDQRYAERDPGRGAVGGAFYDESPAPLTEEEVAGLRGDPGPSLYTTRRVAPLDDEASRHVARYLFPTEKFRGEWKRHWIQLVKEISVGGVATVLMGYITG